MGRPLLIPVVVAGGLLLPSTAGAEIVKAPTGERSTVKVNSATLKTFKKHKLTLSASGQAKKSGASDADDGRTASRAGTSAPARVTSHTSPRTRASGSSAASARRSSSIRGSCSTRPLSGYITALIANERIKFFTVAGTKRQVTDTSTSASAHGVQPQAHAGRRQLCETRPLKRKALKRFSQFGTMDSAADQAAGRVGGSAPRSARRPAVRRPSRPACSRASRGGGSITPAAPGHHDRHRWRRRARHRHRRCLPIDEADIDLDTNTGTIELGGGPIVSAPALGTEVALVDPVIELGATPDAERSLRADQRRARQGRRHRHRTRSTSTSLDGTVTINGLHVTVSGAAAPLINGILGAPVVSVRTRRCCRSTCEFPKL